MDNETLKQNKKEQLFTTVDPGGPGLGLGLGQIAEKYFWASTWESRISEPMGKFQYGKFVAVMVHRIRGEESCIKEVHQFVKLLSTERDADFMRPAVPLIPELRYEIPQVRGRFQMLLLVNLIGNVLRNRALTCTIKTKETTYVNGLPKKELDHIKRLLYGPGGGAGGGPQMDRFVRSFIELGYPRAALEESLRTARGRGQPIERDSEGLPMNLRLPPTDSSIYSFALGPSLSNGISTLTTNCDKGYDCPPKELLEEVTTLPIIGDTYSRKSGSSGSSSTVKEGAPFSGKQSAFKEVMLL